MDLSIPLAQFNRAQYNCRMQILYSTTAHATGDGRNGHVQSDDGFVDADVRIPKEMGGAGGATNPEQLFAAGYAACFHSALRLVAAPQGVDTSGTEGLGTGSVGSPRTGGGGVSPPAPRGGAPR